ncbi:nucleotidyltransferase domain-containing protein [Candidatus Pacearchaeota archaeon]|nr:nucleotidyltransferase domain-containing protein [Candidatus Pacearchaeota archaeon]
MVRDLKEARFLEELKRDISRLDEEINFSKKRKQVSKIPYEKTKTSKTPKIESPEVIINPRERNSGKKIKRLKFSKEIIKKDIKIAKKKDVPTLQLKTEHEIAADFATKAYQKFNKIIKSIILFGSTAKKTQTPGSDIDIIIIIDDASLKWDMELIAWYREELEKLLQINPYKHNLHINTVKLTTWWDDLIRGDPIIVNIIRDGEPLIDFGGFFEPLKFLLATGRIKSTPEAVYSLLQRAPQHISRSKLAELSVVEALFWSMVDSAHAALIAAKIAPPSPEHIPLALKENFADTGKLKMKYITDYRDLLTLHKQIDHNQIHDLKGINLDEWQNKAEDFLSTMTKLVDSLVS